MDEYYISRSTVSQAIDALICEGTFVKKPGKGTFVAIRHINDWLWSMSSTTETIENMDIDRPGARLIKTQVLTLPVYLQRITGIKEAVHIKRVGYADNIPIGVENNYNHVGIGEKIKQYNLNKVSLPAGAGARHHVD